MAVPNAFAVVAGITVFVLGALTLVRVRWEYSTRDRLRPGTSAAVWFAYTLHAGMTLFAAWESYWPLEIRPFLSFVIGTVLFVVGLVIFLAGMLSFRSFRRISGLAATKLVTTGIYRYSRNPQNVGWALFLVGIGLLGRSGMALVLAVLFWLSFRFYLPEEERYLQRIFGDDYKGYCESTSRYLGFPKRAMRRHVE